MQTVIFYSALVLALVCLFLLLFGLAKPRVISKALGKSIPRAWLAAIFGILFIVFAGLAIVTEPETPATDKQHQQQSAKAGYYMVTRVIDGDTIRIGIDGRIETVRLIGIDAPEANECFAQQATAKAQAILRGQQVRLEADDSQDERDAYGRLLRYAFLADGTNFNRLMITEGYAKEYTFIAPYKHQPKFKEAQQEAKGAGKGLWSSGVCEDR
jgi:micrococcal nuclease